MGADTAIEWCDFTFNPWWGCVKVSPGCAHCYAETLTTNRMGLSLWGAHAQRQVTTPANWSKPRKWHREAVAKGVRERVFCASLCDMFEDHPTANEARPRLWELIRACDGLDWQLLTKRPERIAENLPDDWGAGWPHVWLGATIENEDYAWRADCLRAVPAVVRFVSYEPALGPLDALDLDGLHWVVYGGESGPGYRPHDWSWPRAMRDRCHEAGVAFFYKQSPGIRAGTGIELDGVALREWPRPAPQPPASVLEG